MSPRILLVLALLFVGASSSAQARAAEGQPADLSRAAFQRELAVLASLQPPRFPTTGPDRDPSVWVRTTLVEWFDKVDAQRRLADAAARTALLDTVRAEERLAIVTTLATTWSRVIEAMEGAATDALATMVETPRARDLGIAGMRVAYSRGQIAYLEECVALEKRVPKGPTGCESKLATLRSSTAASEKLMEEIRSGSFHYQQGDDWISTTQASPCRFAGSLRRSVPLPLFATRDGRQVAQLWLGTAVMVSSLDLADPSSARVSITLDGPVRGRFWTTPSAGLVELSKDMWAAEGAVMLPEVPR